MRYRVYIRTKIGITPSHDDHLDVEAKNDAEAVVVAIERLNAVGLPDFRPELWIVDRVSQLD